MSNNEQNVIQSIDITNNLLQFNNKPIKYFYYNDNIYFKAKDIALILEYKDTDQAIRKNVDENDKFNYNYFKNYEPVVGTGAGTCSNIAQIFMTHDDKHSYYINESGLYSLIMSSKKAEAKVFSRWVTSEVLPSIRKNGYYINNTIIEQEFEIKLKLKDEEYQKILEEKTLLITQLTNTLNEQHEIISLYHNRKYEEIVADKYIYVFSTDKKNIFKCGRTKDISKRLRALQTALVDDIIELYKCNTSNDVLLESVIHEILNKYRLSKREHFQCDLNYIKYVIYIISTTIDVLKSTYEKIEYTEILNKLYTKLNDSEFNNTSHNEPSPEPLSNSLQVTDTIHESVSVSVPLQVTETEPMNAPAQLTDIHVSNPLNDPLQETINENTINENTIIGKDNKWLVMLNYVKDYINKNNKRPNKHDTNREIALLAEWLTCQLKKKDKISSNPNINKEWCKFYDKYNNYILDNDGKWNLSFNELETFVKKYKTKPKITDSEPRNVQLARWLLVQSRLYKNDNFKYKDKWEHFLNTYKNYL